MDDEKAIYGALAHASAVLVLDERGEVMGSYGDGKRAALSGPALDLIVRAAQTLGARRDVGPLETMMLMYLDEVITVGMTPRGSVAMIADKSVQLGLLFSHIRRLQSDEPPMAEAS